MTIKTKDSVNIVRPTDSTSVAGITWTALPQPWEWQDSSTLDFLVYFQARCWRVVLLMSNNNTIFDPVIFSGNRRNDIFINDETTNFDSQETCLYISE